MANLSISDSRFPDNSNHQRLSEISARLQAIYARRREIENLIAELESENRALRSEVMPLGQEARRLAPNVFGVRYAVPNDMPTEFTTHEIVSYAMHSAEYNHWTGWVEDFYDGAGGASDPLWIDENDYPTPELALRDANVKAAEYARQQKGGGE